jgi:5'-nucleotidase
LQQECRLTTLKRFLGFSLLLLHEWNTVRILLTNDDGIHAPGLQAMHDALMECSDNEVQIVAPAAEQSGVGLSITYLHPLMVHEEFREGAHFGWAVHGSPADCVKLGMLEYCKLPPDLVVSGINSGSNAGINVLYSGTVAGAIEGAFFGVTSIAVSQACRTPPDYDRAARMAVNLIEQILESRSKPGSLWNLNFPETELGPPKGVKLVKMGVKRHQDVMEKREDPRGRPYFWSGLDPIKNHAMEPGTDLKELAEGYITLTPLHFDLTEQQMVRDLQQQEWKLPG